MAIALSAAASLMLICLAPSADTRVQGNDFIDPVATYAPMLVFRPLESAWPDDPARFIENSQLYWYNFAKSGVRECDSNQPRELVSKGPAVDLARLKAGKYVDHYSYQQRRGPSVLHMWKRCRAPVTYRSNELTAPGAKGDARKTSPGHAGFYLDVADFLHPGDFPLGPDYPNAPPLYYDYEPGHYVTYWFFFDFNDRNYDRHEGDWEHVTVMLDSSNHATSITAFRHECDVHPTDWNKLKDWQLLDTHPIVYIASGGHGSWLSAGVSAVCFGKGIIPKGVTDDHLGGGVTWRTWERGLRPAATQPWYGLGVGWGKEDTGHIARRIGQAWGPVGPGVFRKGILPPGAK